MARSSGALRKHLLDPNNPLFNSLATPVCPTLNEVGVLARQYRQLHSFLVAYPEGTTRPDLLLQKGKILGKIELLRQILITVGQKDFVIAFDAEYLVSEHL